MKKSLRGFFGVWLGVFALVNTVGAQTRSPVVTEINFDAVFEWKKPCTLNSEELEARLAKLAPTPGKKWYALDQSKMFSQPSHLFNASYRHSNNLKYLVFGSKEFEPEAVRVMWADGQIDHVAVRYTAQAGDTEASPELLAGIGDALGAHSFTRSGGSYLWSGEHYSASASFTRQQNDTIFVVSVRPINPRAAPAGTMPPASPEKPVPSQTVSASTPELKINLDDLLDWKNPLSFSREEFEKKLSTLEKVGASKPYFLDGGTAESSHVFSPESIRAYKLSFTMLKGTRSPSAMRIEWKDSRASLINVIFSRQENEWDVDSGLLAQLDEAFEVSHQVLSTDPKIRTYSWRGADFTASISAHPTQPRYFLSMRKTQPVALRSPVGIPDTPVVPAPKMEPAKPLSVAAEPKIPVVSFESKPTDYFKLRLTQVNGLLISQLSSGEKSGQVTTMTLTVLPKKEGGKESFLDFNQDVGASMRRALNQVRNFSLQRHKSWPDGYSLEIGFDDKYIDKDGPSAAVACALLLESAVTGRKWDPEFAVTGDLTSEGNVRPIGGVRAKIRGATKGSCKIVAVPAKNERAVADLILLDGPAPLLGITVFGIKTFDDVVALATPERSTGLKLALADFEAMRAVLLRNPGQITPLLRSPHAIARLEALLLVAPDCYSAKYLLLHAQGRSARVLSLGGSIEAAQSSAQAIVNSIENDVATTLSSLKPDEVGTSLNRLRQLRPILDQRVWPYVDGVTDYGEVIRSTILNPVRSGARYSDLVDKARTAARAAAAAYNTLMNKEETQEELGL